MTRERKMAATRAAGGVLAMLAALLALSGLTLILTPGGPAGARPVLIG